MKRFGVLVKGRRFEFLLLVCSGGLGLLRLLVRVPPLLTHLMQALVGALTGALATELLALAPRAKGTLNGRSRGALVRFASWLVPSNLRPRYSRMWRNDYKVFLDEDGPFAAFRFAVGLLVAALGVRYLYAVTGSQLVAMTTAERTVELVNAQRTRRAIGRSGVVFLLLALGSFRYHYSMEVALGGVILNLCAAWITSE
jgi:hypothetical protein